MKANKVKKLLAISLLTVAGLFGVSSIVINKQSNDNIITEEAKADTTYDYFWFYEACDWANDNEFDGNVGEDQCYTIWYNGKQNTNKCYFGKDYRSGTQYSYSEVYGPRLAKIYYDPSITSVIEIFNDRTTMGYAGPECYMDINPYGHSGEVYILSSFHWGGSGKQTGSWISYETLTSTWLRPIYLTISDEAYWSSYRSNLGSLWFWSEIKLVDSNGSTMNSRQYGAYQLDHSTIRTYDGKYYAETWIPKTISNQTEVVDIQVRTAYNGSGRNSTTKQYYSASSQYFGSYTTPCFTITSYNTSSNQTGDWDNLTFPITYRDQGDVAFSGTHGESYPTTFIYRVGATLDTPTKENLWFGGYYSDEDCTGSVVASISTTDWGAQTVYVKWVCKITWTNYNGAELDVDYIDIGSTPEYTGPTPTKPQVGDHSYDFNTWDPAVGAVSANTTYTATFTANTVSPKDTTIMIATTDNGSDMPNYTTFFNDTIAVYCWNKTGTFTKAVKADHIANTRIAYATLPAGINYFKIARVRENPEQTTKAFPFDGWPGDNGWIVDNTWGSDTKKIGYDYADGTDHLNKNLIQINGWGEDSWYWESARVVLPAGMPVYIATDDNATWWFGDSSVTKLFYELTDANYYGITTTNGFITMTRVGTTNYLYCVPSTTIVANNIQIDRNVGGSDWVNGTTQITVPYGYYNTCVVNIEDGKTGDKQNWGTKGIPETINAYGALFMDKVQCTGAGSISPGADWSTVSYHYSHLGLSTQGNIWLTEPNTSGTLIEKAMARYDYIVFYKQYSGYDDFIGRATTGSGHTTSAIKDYNGYNLVTNEEISVSTIIILVISSISLISITALNVMLVKKRK